MKRDDGHAKENAQGWVNSIVAMVGALECDFDRLEELRDMKADPDRYIMDADEEQELADLIAIATIDGDEFKSAEDVRERIQESPLSVEVRGGWYSPGGDGDKGKAEEFQILLSTGGPALRIMGELDEHGEPTRAWLEYQDWGTPWTHHYVEGFGDVLLKFCQQFYFGE